MEIKITINQHSVPPRIAAARLRFEADRHERIAAGCRRRYEAHRHMSRVALAAEEYAEWSNHINIARLRRMEADALDTESSA